MANQTEIEARARPRLTNAEKRYLISRLSFERVGHYDAETNRWVYPTDVARKLHRMIKPKAAKD